MSCAELMVGELHFPWPAGLPVEAVAAATALTAALSSLLCGLLANMPVGVSPGMGVNAYFVFSQVRSTPRRTACQPLQRKI